MGPLRLYSVSRCVLCFAFVVNRADWRSWGGWFSWAFLARNCHCRSDLLAVCGVVRTGVSVVDAACFFSVGIDFLRSVSAVAVKIQNTFCSLIMGRNAV